MTKSLHDEMLARIKDAAILSLDAIIHLATVGSTTTKERYVRADQLRRLPAKTSPNEMILQEKEVVTAPPDRQAAEMLIKLATLNSEKDSLPISIEMSPVLNAQKTKALEERTEPIVEEPT